MARTGFVRRCAVTAPLLRSTGSSLALAGDGSGLACRFALAAPDRRLVAGASLAVRWIGTGPASLWPLSGSSLALPSPDRRRVVPDRVRRGSARRRRLPPCDGSGLASARGRGSSLAQRSMDGTGLPRSRAMSVGGLGHGELAVATSEPAVVPLVQLMAEPVTERESEQSPDAVDPVVVRRHDDAEQRRQRIERSGAPGSIASSSAATSRARTTSTSRCGGSASPRTGSRPRCIVPGVERPRAAVLVERVDVAEVLAALLGGDPVAAVDRRRC